ncbi:uncharacterized protein LOC135839412 [Planococcus citri]|uniref:uncharacterized protein LOC135839412 n=1 Tax=Planococcus citri TaxID=170843 RepID=UPI0031F9EA27
MTGKHKRVIFLSYSLLLFEIIEFCAAASPDELNIPYVPYVVVEQSKDKLDLDRVQQTIFKYLENRSQRQTQTHQEEDEAVEQSTTLYDYLKTSTGSTGVYDYLRTSTGATAFQDKPTDTRNSKLHPLNFHTPNYVHMDAAPTTYRGHLPYRYETTPVYNLSSSPSISKSYDTYATRYYPSVTDMTMQETKFVPLKESVYSSMQEGSLMGYQVPKKTSDYSPYNNLPFGGNMKCSLRSSRYVYDGECKSKKPIVETVCADRCIKYDYNKLNQHHSVSPYHIQYQKPADAQKPVVALACKDGDVKKQKIKLYCKDGTIINNIIRIVNSCICQEHSEKVHAKKKSVMPVENLRKRAYSRRTLPKVQMFPRFK